MSTAIIDHALTHWGRVTHICISDLTITGSDNGLSPSRRQAIIRTNAWILLTRPLGTNFSEILIEILIFSFRKMRLKVSSAKWRPFYLGLNVLNSLVRTDRVIIARYREDCPSSERLRISISHRVVPELLTTQQSVQHSVDGMFKCIPFNGSAVFRQSLCL